MSAKAVWKSGNLLPGHFSWGFSLFLFFKCLLLEEHIHGGEIHIKTATAPFAVARPRYVGDNNARSFSP